jgi:hypothetical protein
MYGTLQPKDRNLEIDKIYLAVDEKNLYMKFEIKDQNNFMTDHRSSYGLDLENGTSHVIAKLYYQIGGSDSGWQVQIVKIFNTEAKLIDTSGQFEMKGNTLEASFPLEPIKKNLGRTSGSYTVFGRTHYDDDKGHLVAGTGDVTVTKHFVFFTEGQAAAPAEDSLQDGDVVPKAAIKIDGKFEDWKGILPAFTSGTRSPKERNQAIDNIALAVDEKNLYMKFDIKDATPSSFFHPYNFDTSHNNSYNLDVWAGTNHVTASVGFVKGDSRWHVNLGHVVQGSWSQIDQSGNYAMKGASLEASFPLELIRKNLGVLAPGEFYKVCANTAFYDDQWKRDPVAGDITETKYLTF